MKAHYAALAVAVLLAPALAAQSFEERHQAAMAANPEGLKLEVRPAAAPLRVGAPIPLVLSFTNHSAKAYDGDGRTYDRGGLLGTEAYICEDASVRDARSVLGDLFLSLGGIGNILRPGPQASEVRVPLHPWLRFERPGRYRLYAVSNRLAELLPEGSAARSQPVLVASGIFELEILPEDTEASARMLEAARQTLSVAEWDPHSSVPPAAYAALEDLRALGSAAAVNVGLSLARRRGERVDAHLLAGARKDAHAADALEAYMADPQVAICLEDVRLLGLLLLRDQGKSAPEYAPVAANADAGAKRAAYEARSAAMDAIYRVAAERLIPAAAAKQAAVRAASVSALAFWVPEARLRAK